MDMESEIQQPLYARWWGAGDLPSSARKPGLALGRPSTSMAQHVQEAMSQPQRRSSADKNTENTVEAVRRRCFTASLLEHLQEIEAGVKPQHCESAAVTTNCFHQHLGKAPLYNGHVVFVNCSVILV